MKFKILPRNLRKQTNNILNKNERLQTNIVDPTPSSVFDRSHRHLTTFNSSHLVPIYVDECYPGDIHSIDCSTLMRLSTPAAATMENPVYDVHFYFVPYRIIWDAFKYFMGENKSAGYQKSYKNVPTIQYDLESFSYREDDLASYLGIPQGVDMSKLDVPINSLYFKAYGKIWNDYYRDQNLDAEIDITNNNRPDENVPVSNYWVDGNDFHQVIQIGKYLAPVSRLADYFSTCLPYPQKGETVSIDTLSLATLKGKAPVINDANFFGRGYRDNRLNVYNEDGLSPALNSGSDTQVVFLAKGQNQAYVQNTPTSNSPQSSSSLYLRQTVDFENEKSTVKISGAPFSVNDLRLSLALQHMRELDARGGTRYIEYILNHFGVQTSDVRLDRAEFIGGFRDNINISNVVQSSAGSASSPLGVLGGVSVSSGTTPKTINYAVKEHGIIMGFVIVRPQVNYSQGLHKMFTRTEKIDYYDPLLANIGEQPVYKYELFLTDNKDTTNNQIFGYNEAWAELRYASNKLSGYLSVNSTQSLASLYAYTERYTNAPTLAPAWMNSDSGIIGSTLLLNSDKTEYVHQFLGDFYFNVKSSRKMPVFSIPGLRKV